MKKTGRNDPCPCGSGKKFKKCCLPAGVKSGYTQEERERALAKIVAYVGDVLGPDDDAAFDQFWGDFAEHPEDLEQHAAGMSEHVYDLWYAFDRLLEDGRLVVDRFLEEPGVELSAGEKACLLQLHASSMRLYDIEDARPGETLTLRDVVEGDRVTVRERRGSRSLNRHDWIAARVVSRGASGRPEIEGLLPIPRFFHDSLRDQLLAWRGEYLRDIPGEPLDLFYKSMPPVFHEVWVGAILDPYVPEMANTDGEEMILTVVLFDVLDHAALTEALRKTEGLSEGPKRGGEQVWEWRGRSIQDDETLIGWFKLQDDTLRLETNSVERGERGRPLVETIAGNAVRFRAATHEDMRRRLKESLRSGGTAPGPSQAEEIPPEVCEALTLDFTARHFRSWLDESIPALEDHSPREAARSDRLRPKLIDLLHDLDRQYQHALRRGQPAFDASWIWSELGIEDDSPEYPPLLAHERVDRLIPGTGQTCRSVAEALRLNPGFDDTRTIISSGHLHENLEIQRMLRRQGAERADHEATSACDLTPYLVTMVNFELHRRKSFWVDAALAYMLANTDIDVPGRELRVPFPSFALIFTDRFVLSLAERLLARQADCPLAGEFLRVATVFVTERTAGEERALEISFALDALGANLPYLVTHHLPLQEEASIQSYLDEAAPLPPVEAAPPHANPLRGLLQITINTTLYATSSGVAPKVRHAPTEAVKRHHHGMEPGSYSSNEVFFLPGPIEISNVRRLQELGRISSGREILKRFMVRGHWRRPAANWKDQHMRWIQPYWKGPDIATIIERTYKLKP